MTTAGVDIGSKSIKVVILRDGEVAACGEMATGFDQNSAAEDLLNSTICEAGDKQTDVAHVTVTGVGRKTADFADSTLTDVSAAGLGANHLKPGAETVIEIGAEESRAIRTDGAGRVLDSAVNAKCAAGSGSFTESMARALGMSLEEFSQASLLSDKRIPMNAQCTVFAESEVVSLIHSGTEKRDIARAVHDAIGSRVATMAKRVGMTGEVTFVGGLARNRGLAKSLTENLGIKELTIPEHPELAGAIGAALAAAKRAG